MSNQQIVPAGMILPNKLLIVPLQGKPIFPGIFTPMMIKSQEDILVIERALDADAMIGLVLVKSEEIETPSTDDFFNVGTVAKIVKKINLPDGGMNIFISTLRRFHIKKFLTPEAPIAAAVEYLDDIEEKSDEVTALTRSLIGEMKQVSENNPLFSEEMRLNMVNIDDPGKIADFITSILNIDRADQQAVLEQLNVKRRMEQVLLFIKKEQELLRLQKKIQMQINEKIEKSQREYYLKEELKTIKQELGMPTDSKSSDYLRFKEAMEKLQLTGEAKEQVEREVEKFQLMEPSSPEFGLVRNYLDTVINLPWNDPVPENIELDRARKILDADHYGLEDVKERIIEFLAVRKLRKDSKGSIICLVGPPGVGKTSVGMSIARALQKKFFRFSVGGMRDEAEIKGHRRTYIGAMPGKVIQGLKVVKSKNPVFMIDEIDKLAASYQGDPASALLEVLDPEQNVAFRDHYLDLPFDISDILFIATANTLDTIPPPLLDRMEVIRLSGYIDKEKIEIARKYLLPKSLKRSGIERKRVKYTNAALLGIANGYAREAGMRNFEKALDRIHRKLAVNIVKSNSGGTSGKNRNSIVSIDEANLESYLGKPTFRDDEIKVVTSPGMVIGLAWTPFGGDTLVIEAAANNGREGFKLTGQMGDVMQESANIAYTYVRSVGTEYGIEDKFWENKMIHIHIPAGATPKDGPSAGVTMASALFSLALGKRIRSRLAMTGELSLVGNVLPIGGLKEKTIAARRARIKTIIIPEKNLRDLDEIPDHIKKGITFHPVQTMGELIDRLF